MATREHLASPATHIQTLPGGPQKLRLNPSFSQFSPCPTRCAVSPSVCRFHLYCCIPVPPDPVFCARISHLKLFPIASLMSQHASSSSQTISSQSLNRGDLSRGWPIQVVKQFRRGQVSKVEAILEIQANPTSGEAEPSNSELISALASYIGILNDIECSARKNQPEGGT